MPNKPRTGTRRPRGKEAIAFAAKAAEKPFEPRPRRGSSRPAVKPTLPTIGSGWADK